VFTTIVPILNEEGSPREFLSIRYDITDKKRLEEENIKNLQKILETKINQEMSECFVSSLTHDMRTPLTSSKLSAQMILRNLENKESIKKYASIIISNLNRSDDMIMDLLNVTKIRAGQKLDVFMELCDAIDISKRCIDELATIYGERFDLYTYGVGTGVWSSSGIKRIIENLCINAVKYGDVNRKITVSIIVDDEELRIEVHNWGEVIKEEESSSLFDYLQRSDTAQKGSKKGWGIGLTLVKGMAESHQGKVEVSSTLELGTTFKVKLPKQAKLEELY
jgi:signal transduction histidine kinase